MDRSHEVQKNSTVNDLGLHAGVPRSRASAKRIKLANRSTKSLEIGSEFHWMGFPPSPLQPWPAPAVWYSLGRHAVLALVHELSPRRLWLPDFFCREVAESWSGACTIVEYEDDPRWLEPNWPTLQPAAGDFVVAVNYFGVRQGEGWRRWREKNACVLIDDHSHDPLSSWALNSTADYAFSSLRKTIAVPDGAILWSPRGLLLPVAPAQESTAAAALKLAAMVWKSEYLARGHDERWKGSFRTWQLEGQVQLTGLPISTISPLSREYLSGGVPKAWRERRRDNVSYLMERLRRFISVRPIFRSWPEGNAPLATVLEFESAAARDNCREMLRESGVYCSVHWACPETASSRARELAARVLSIPADQRYGAKDMQAIAAILRRGWDCTSPPNHSLAGCGKSRSEGLLAKGSSQSV